MKTWFLHKVRNGWIVTPDDFFTPSTCEKLFVFPDMRQVAAFLIKVSGELPKRDAKGHFLPAKNKSLP